LDLSESINIESFALSHLHLFVFVLHPVTSWGRVSFAIPKDEVNMKKDEKRNFLYTLRSFCEMTITEASQAGGIPISVVHEYETEGVRLLPIRYLIAMKREANVSWETIGELMEKWNEERPLRKRHKLVNSL
jgi:hypothetical protein